MIASSRFDESHRSIVRDADIEAAAIARKTDSAPPRPICPWCPDFDPHDPAHAGASHGMCPTCAARVSAELDAIEASR